ncbi:MAG: ImmA/IrrE family metallo-endopeptidase [Pirellulales bacterium]
MADPIAQAAEAVLSDLGLWKLPVNPLRIAEEEGIEIAAGFFGSGFDARIEYYPAFDRFAIYYQNFGPYRPEGRVRFSLAHELGHFYLPEHRTRLRSGGTHNSVADYASGDPMEREADRFASALLMPKELFVAEVRNFRGGFCTLKDLCALSERLLTSITSTAIRYCDCQIDAATVILSRDRMVLWSWPSEDMRYLGMSYVERGSRIPPASRTGALYDRNDVGSVADQIEGPVDSSIWFEWPKRSELWEEAMFLGDRVLTYLAAPES